MYSSFNNFTNLDLIEYLKSLNVKVKLERGNRYFLDSDNANELVESFKKELRKYNVKVLYNSIVNDIIVKNGIIESVLVNDKIIKCDRCIICTGGKSYPSTGSTGDGYVIAEKLGHKIVDIKQGLVGLKSIDKVCKELQGLNLKNVKVTVYDENKLIYNDFGELLFTHFGLSGPTVLSSSSVINRIDNLKTKLKDNKIYISIDLKPALDKLTLDKRICRDFEKYNNKEFKNSLNDLLPKKLIPVIIKKSGIDENKKVNQITKEERNNLINLIKDFKIYINDLMSIETAIVTCGGVDTKEINPKTLESKIIKGLYFAGEIIDIDAFTGGFNLQIAFSTGITASNV